MYLADTIGSDPNTSPSPSRSSPPIGPIVGGAVGGLIVGAIITSILLLLYRRRKDRKTHDGVSPTHVADEDDTGIVETPFMEPFRPSLPEAGT